MSEEHILESKRRALQEAMKQAALCAFHDKNLLDNPLLSTYIGRWEFHSEYDVVFLAGLKISK